MEDATRHKSYIDDVLLSVLNQTKKYTLAL